MSVNWYDNAGTAVRADQAGQFDPLTRSDSYRVTDTLVLSNNITDTPRSPSTSFCGEQGSEKANYSINHKQDGVTISSMSVNWYDKAGTAVRADQAGQFDPLTRSDSYRVTDTLVLSNNIKDTQRSSSTFFFGEQGSEKANYSINYKQDGVTISSMSVNWYDKAVTAVRADQAGQFDPLTRSDSYRVTDTLVLSNNIKDTQRSSSTFFFGEQGSEKANYAIN